MRDWSNGSPDFDLYVYDPNGNLVGRSEGTSRQETVTFNPTVTGTYKITELTGFHPTV
jgi:serine protease AprX